MNKLGSYPAYKPTAIPWLPQVPEHWSEMKVKYIFRERVQKGYPNEPLLAATQSMGVVTKETYGERTVTAQKDLHLLKLVEKNDFVISLRSFQGGIEVSHARGIISPAYTILRISHDCAPGYLAFLLKSAPFIDGLKLFITGIREGQNIDYARLARTYLPWPPLEEQHLIVRYLRALDAKVKRYIRTKRKLIAALQEQKQAIIQRAVTRGLNPNVKLKPSGVEWMGEVPEHWEVVRLRSAFTSVDSGAWGSDVEREGDEDNIYCMRAADFDMQTFSLNPAKRVLRKVSAFDRYRKELAKGDLLLEKSGGGDAVPVGRVVYADGAAPMVFSNFLTRLRPDQKRFNSRYLLYLLNTLHSSRVIMTDIKQTTGLQNLDERAYLSRTVLTPRLDQQLAIVAHLDRECAKVNLTISSIQRDIHLMQEYHTRLIADVVTGAVDVREAAGKLPEEDQMIRQLDDQMMEEEALSMAAEGEAEYGEE